MKCIIPTLKRRSTKKVATLATLELETFSSHFYEKCGLLFCFFGHSMAVISYYLAIHRLVL